MANSTEKPILHDSGAAAADYSSSQYYAVYHSAAETLTLCAAQGAWQGGPLQDNPESGEFGTVMLLGLSQAKAGGTWAVGNPLTTDSSGKLVKSVNNTDFIVGRALEVAATNNIKTMFLSHEGYNSAFGDFAADGRGDLHLLRSTYSFAVDGGVASTISLGETLPDNAVVVRGYYFVSTALTSGGSATIALSIASDDVAGLLAAAAIATAGSAGWHECIQTGTAANFSEACTAERAIQIVIGTADLTAGVLTLFLEYVIID